MKIIYAVPLHRVPPLQPPLHCACAGSGTPSQES